MGQGKEAAERLKQQAEDQQQQQAASLKRGIMTQQNSEAHWDALVAALQREVAEFVESFPQAKTQNLRADLLNSNNLTISTQVQPILKIEVLRNYRQPGVQAEITRQVGWDHKQGHTPNFDFAPDGFSDGRSVISPEQLAGKFFEYIPEFFA